MLNARRPAGAVPGTAPLASPREALVAFIALLERERLAMTQPDADVIEAITAEKQALARTLHAFGAGGHQVAPADSTRARKDRQEIAALARRAKQLNAGNASLMAIHRNSCEGRLRVLRGSAQGSALYSANGYLGH